MRLTADYNGNPCSVAGDDSYDGNIHPHEIVLERSQHAQGYMRDPDGNTVTKYHLLKAEWAV